MYRRPALLPVLYPSGLVEFSNRPEAREFADRVLELLGTIGDNLPILGDFFGVLVTLFDWLAAAFGWVDRKVSPLITALSDVFGWLERISPAPLKPLFNFLQEITEDGLGDMLVGGLALLETLQKIFGNPRTAGGSANGAKHAIEWVPMGASTRAVDSKMAVAAQNLDVGAHRASGQGVVKLVGVSKVPERTTL